MQNHFDHDNHRDKVGANFLDLIHKNQLRFAVFCVQFQPDHDYNEIDDRDHALVIYFMKAITMAW